MNVIRSASFVGIQFRQDCNDVFRDNREGVHWYYFSVERWWFHSFVVSESGTKSICQKLTFVCRLCNAIAICIYMKLAWIQMGVYWNGSCV